MLTNVAEVLTERCAVMAEWLRRLTRNQMGATRAGSNPADCVFLKIMFGGVGGKV